MARQEAEVLRQAFATALALVALTATTSAEERSVRAVRRDYEQRISQSWEVRLERMDRDREREARREERRRERDWRRLTAPRDSRDEECDE